MLSFGARAGALGRPLTSSALLSALRRPAPLGRPLTSAALLSALRRPAQPAAARARALSSGTPGPGGRTWGFTLSMLVRWPLLATGAAVWLWSAYEWYDPAGADEILDEYYDDEGGPLEYDPRGEARRFYDVSDEVRRSPDASRTELDAKDRALGSLLRKLEKQPELEERLGRQPLALWPGSHGMPGREPELIARDPDSPAIWMPSFFLNGPMGTCVVDVTMEKNRLGEWTPTSIRVEELARSGSTVLRAAADLPHGLAYANRLSTYSGADDSAAK
ncbi:hypothetical protein T492DRAFT_983293 [Pavlovales sp. CCMP2436]|nr:hypothetical protein T492DRAFT_983293 [Pavlovales sp. CCMP2436]